MSKQRQDEWVKTWVIEEVHLMTGLSIDDLEAGKGPEMLDNKGGQIRYLRSVVERWIQQRSETKENDERSEVNE